MFATAIHDCLWRREFLLELLLQNLCAQPALWVLLQQFPRFEVVIYLPIWVVVKFDLIEFRRDVYLDKVLS